MNQSQPESRIRQPSFTFSLSSVSKYRLDNACYQTQLTQLSSLRRPGIADMGMLYEITTAAATAPPPPPTPPPEVQQQQILQQQQQHRQQILQQQHQQQQILQQQEQQQTFHIPAEVLQAITEAPQTTDTVVKSLNARKEREL